MIERSARQFTIPTRALAAYVPSLASDLFSGFVEKTDGQNICPQLSR